MAIVITKRSIICIEWTACVPYDFPSIHSDFFTVHGFKCSFEYRQSLSADKSYLVFKSDKVLGEIINISLYQEIYYHKRKDRREITWIFLGHKLGLHTFKVLIEVCLQEGNEPEISADGHNICLQSQKPSNSRQNIHLEALSMDFSKLLKESSNCDVKIACDTKTFNVHKIVLGTRSAVLSAMLKSNMVEGETGLVKIEDVKAPIFEDFLYYLYSGKVPELNMETSMDLYEVSDKYAVGELRNACAEFLIRNLCEDKACEVLVLADLHNDKDFREMVISYIIDKKLPQRHRCWLDFCKSNPVLSNEVLNVYIQKHCSK